MLFTDTGSLMFEIETDDAYLEMFNDRERFDLASYPRASEFYDPSTNKVCQLISFFLC